MPFQRPAYQRKEVFSALGQSKNWGIDMFQVPELWKYSKGKGVKIAILDTGATDPAHVDLQGAYVACRNFTSDKPDSFIDRDSHGTAVAGVIGARDNDFGVIGIAPECSLYSAKVLRDDGTGDERFVIDAIDWAIEMGVDIINMSFGTRKQPTRALQEAIRKAYINNITLFAASGNVGENGNIDTIDWPAKYPEVISVGSINRDQLRSTFSSVGQRIDLLAPGEDIITTSLNNDYVTMSGTCLAEGSYVYSVEGPKKIETIIPGDIVYAFKNGKIVERPVLQNHYRGTNTVHQLRASGRDVFATETHKMLCLDLKQRDIDWVGVKDLDSKRHKLLLPRALPSRINPYLDSILDEEFCWLLGFFTGDGWLAYTKKGMRVNFARGNKEDVIEEVERIYRKYSGNSFGISNSGTWCFDSSTKMAMIIDALGLSSPAKEKSIPLWIWTLSKEKQISFYKGYRTADGHIYKNDSYKVYPDAFDCSSPDLIRRLACFADYNGWEHSTVSHRDRFIKAPNSKEARYINTNELKIIQRENRDGFSCLKTPFNKSGNNGIKIAEEMGLDINNIFASGYRIDEDKGIRNVYDLTVPDADCFITQGLITHNSFACPFAVGVAALCIASHRVFPSKTPCETPTQVREHLLKTAIDVGAPGWDKEGGFGIIHPVSVLDTESLAKSEVVGDFRVSNRVVPELQYIKARKKVDPIRVAQLTMNFTVETFDGEQKGLPGDFLAVDGKGAVFIITKEEFEKYYETV